MMFKTRDDMKVQKVCLLQQSHILGESHPVPTQALLDYNKLQKATEVPSLEN